MDNRISEIRKVIRALRVSMREAETVMHEQIEHDEDCSFIAEEILRMRQAMSNLVKERAALGDIDLSWSLASLSPAARQILVLGVQ